MSKTVSVRVPATTANLGCMFDCAALALSLYLDVRATPRSEPGIHVSYRGVTPERIRTDDSNLIARTICQALEGCGKSRGFDLEIENQIPVGVGLGSSAAAVVAGLFAGHALADRVLLDEELIAQAAKIEGHPDNAAAAWLGGFALSVQAGDRVISCSYPVPDLLQFALVIPDYPLPTDKAREVLPESYSRADAIHNLQRAALVAAKFASGIADFSRSLFDDRWHQPYRAPLIPGLPETLKLKLPGLLGVCLSGAGPAILAITKGNGATIGDAIRQKLQEAGVKSEVVSLTPDNKGAKGWNR